MDSEMTASLLAYLDPGAGSLLLQALVGGGAGLVVFGKYMWDAVCRSLNERRTAGTSK
jgi:hypothetical protein